MKKFKLIHSSRLVSSLKRGIPILFMVLTSFSMFGQKIINPPEKTVNAQHGLHESTAIKKEPHLTGTGNNQLLTLTEAQIEFNVRQQAFVDSCMKDQNHLTQYSAQNHTCSADKEVDIASLAMEGARNQFVHENLEAYKHLFISSTRSVAIPDLCDNGGFEQDFLYYDGFTSTYLFGSDSCSPQTNFGPSVFIPATLPTTNRFEIVTSGVDPLVGINRTKFGDKALRINNHYGHLQNCFFNGGLDKITKTFKVTSENRIFNIWYAVVLENPDNIPHPNRQPFINISCDLAPLDELCFAADFLNCEDTVVDPLCNYRPLDVLDWTCHKFRIDPSFIGDTATLEITVADCGFGGHFGYAYIDGICEDCDDSALGDIFLDSINYLVNCAGDTANICGSYNAPEICNKNWWLDSIMINGYSITDISIDTGLKVFCFDFPISNFSFSNCLDVFITGGFTDGSTYIPFQTSNDIEICKDNYFNPEIDIEVGGCMDNTPIPPGVADNNISDDYYYVYVDIDNAVGLNWTIERTLIDPYPDEEDTREIANGTGNAIIELGPFRIQEGGWYLTLYLLDSCEYVEYIEPPAYCSGCEDFYEVEIGNVQCYSSNNTWSFDIEVPSETSGSYKLNDISRNYNEVYTISGLTIGNGCQVYTLEGAIGCLSEFIICPPKPCSTNCNLEVYVEDVPCTKDEFGDITYYVDLEVQWPPSRYACYEARSVANGTLLDEGPLPLNQQIGPFEEDIYLKIKVCISSCSSTASCPCYKTIYVPTPDCNLGGSRQFSKTSKPELHAKPAVYVQPNPTHSDEIIIYSSLPKTEYEILDVQGKRIVTNSFIGQQQSQSLHVPPGMYFLKYRNLLGQLSVIKILKQ